MHGFPLCVTTTKLLGVHILENFSLNNNLSMAIESLDQRGAN